MSENSKKISKYIIILFIVIGVGVVFLASFLGRKSVTDLNNYKGFFLVASENEMDGTKKNRVEYYSYNSFDSSVLEELCRKKAKIYKASDFHTYNMVVFSSKDTVVNSKYPIGSRYGDELDKLKNIKAFYVCTNYNTFSELSFYETNAAESIAIRKNIK